MFRYSFFKSLTMTLKKGVHKEINYGTSFIIWWCHSEGHFSKWVFHCFTFLSFSKMAFRTEHEKNPLFLKIQYMVYQSKNPIGHPVALFETNSLLLTVVFPDLDPIALKSAMSWLSILMCFSETFKILPNALRSMAKN